VRKKKVSNSSEGKSDEVNLANITEYLRIPKGTLNGRGSRSRNERESWIVSAEATGKTSLKGGESPRREKPKNEAKRTEKLVGVTGVVLKRKNPRGTKGGKSGGSPCWKKKKGKSSLEGSARIPRK